MPCFSPLTGFRSAKRTKNGKYPVVIDNQPHGDATITVPCGQCIGCRLAHATEWAIRISHEAQMHEQNSFLTLTYDNKNCPPDGSLDRRHFQLFLKRLRKRLAPRRIRFYHCGEYGEQYSRPHYHAIIFGYDFAEDRVLWKQTKDGKLWTSAELEELWGKGFCSIGEVNKQTAGYCARYVTKKLSGKRRSEYEYINPLTGQVHQIDPEYSTMSNRPGIGASWFEKYWRDCFPCDFVVMDGKKHPVPNYYLSFYGLWNPEGKEEIEQARATALAAHAANNTPERLVVREKVQKARSKALTREYENANTDV